MVQNQANGRRIALVLGASGDIGAATALELGDAGLDLVLSGRRRERLMEVAERVAIRTGAVVHVVAADLTNEQAAPEIVAEAVGRFGRLDVLVSTAGEFRQGTLLDLTSADWTDGFAAMFFGAVRMVKTAWPYLVESHGHVVLVSGVFAIRPRTGSTLASAIAAALLNFSKSAAELGLRDGVSVNAVLPGRVSGRRLDEVLVRFSQSEGINLADAPEAYARYLGVERVARPEEIGKLIAFLASDAGSYIRGASVVIDGGATRAL
ncbi:SDR family oxidoreductase [Paraburkholderia caffeinilytica]|uniref:SDR family oxidoreductase n=1 Tax=Paraburkholderia caffeinilytica TaxID=1761016 RepID=UPI003DA0287C